MTKNQITPITVAYGDGIGPEIMEATLKILKDADARISIDVIEVGKKIYELGHSSGISDESWEVIKRNKILLKSPITTPQGGGYKSLNVTMRKALGLYSNVRPCVSFHPFVKTNHPKLDVVVVRENEEDLYVGVEYRPTHNMYESLKLISRTGSEKIIRYAFEYAVKYGRKKVTCFVKDNIMKLSDGIFHKVFDEIAKEYPSIKNDTYIVDIGAARLANRPEDFDVIVTTNLYGDVISDIVAETSGSVGLAGSANIGNDFAMFEAIHGSAPDIAGKQIANPSGLLNGAIMMLVHIGQADVATKIHNAWLKTIEEGIHTSDIFTKENSKQKVSTMEFAEAVCARLGQKPSIMPAVQYSAEDASGQKTHQFSLKKSEKRTLVGIDVYVCHDMENANEVAAKINEFTQNCDLGLQAIISKGLKVWPEGNNGKILSDHWCLRFAPKNTEKVTNKQEILKLLGKIVDADLDFIKTELLWGYDGIPGFSMPQG